jgi:hypothetical protein
MNPTEMLEKLRRGKDSIVQDDKTRAAGQIEFMEKVYEGLKQVQPLMKFRKKKFFGSSVEQFTLSGNLEEMNLKFGDFSLTCGFSRKEFRIWPDQALLAMDSLFIGAVAYDLIKVKYASDAVDVILRILVKYEES